MSHEGKDRTWAGRAAAGTKRGKPGDVDSDGFIIPGRPVRKPAPKGSSKVDLAELGDNIVAPIERYVGNTSMDITADLVEKVLMKCSEGLNEGSPLEIIKVQEIGTHLKNAGYSSRQMWGSDE